MAKFCIHINIDKTYVRIGIVMFPKFVKEFWPMIDDRICLVFFSQYFEKDSNFVYTLILTRSMLALLCITFRKFVTELRSLIDARLFFVSQYLEKELAEFDQILYTY